MNTFDLDHWLQHDRENHYKLYSIEKPFNYQQITYSKPASLNNNTNQANTSQVTKSFSSFTDFVDNYKSSQNDSNHRLLVTLHSVAQYSKLESVQRLVRVRRLAELDQLAVSSN